MLYIPTGFTQNCKNHVNSRGTTSLLISGSYSFYKHLPNYVKQLDLSLSQLSHGEPFFGAHVPPLLPRFQTKFTSTCNNITDTRLQGPISHQKEHFRGSKFYAGAHHQTEQYASHNRLFPTPQQMISYETLPSHNDAISAMSLLTSQRLYS